MNFENLYSITLPIVATANLIMGISLLLIYRTEGTKKMQYRLGFRLIGIAMLIIAFINYWESFFPFFIKDSSATLSITLFAASIEMFLLMYAYIALLDIRSITRRRIITELACICIFVLPVLFVEKRSQSVLFELLFYIALSFYLVKYVINIRIYFKLYKKVQDNLLNYYGSGNQNLLSWVHRTFYIVLLLGGVSIIVPLANYMVLFFYQIFVFLAYFYIYWEVIRHEFIFNDIILIDKSNNSTIQEEEATSSVPLPMNVFKQWMEQRHYTKVGVTIDDVATQLKTNRTTLSLYLNSELKMNFYEWISKLRMEDAQKVLIENPGLPIAEVAAFVGIEDRSNFDKLFKRIVGLSPSNYRIQEYKKLLAK